MKKIRGYFITLVNYFNNPKGRHDILDYLRAFVIFLFTAMCFVLAFEMIW